MWRERRFQLLDNVALSLGFFGCLVYLLVMDILRLIILNTKVFERSRDFCLIPQYREMTWLGTMQTRILTGNGLFEV